MGDWGALPGCWPSLGIWRVKQLLHDAGGTWGYPGTTLAQARGHGGATPLREAGRTGPRRWPTRSGAHRPTRWPPGGHRAYRPLAWELDSGGRQGCARPLGQASPGPQEGEGGLPKRASPRGTDTQSPPDRRFASHGRRGHPRLCGSGVSACRVGGSRPRSARTRRVLPSAPAGPARPASSARAAGPPSEVSAPLR